MPERPFASLVAPIAALILCVPVVDQGEASERPVLDRRPSPASGATLALQQVGQLPPTNNHGIGFGDTDHDGRNEALLLGGDCALSGYHVFEEQGDNVYVDVFAGPFVAVVEIADLDRDGKSEVVGPGVGTVSIYESSSVSTHPSELVWSTSRLTCCTTRPAIGDTDRDGRMEIISSGLLANELSTVYIWENTGDNAYTEVFATNVKRDVAGEKVIADFDGDGLIEFATSGYNGAVYVYESPADNVWRETWVTLTGFSNASTAEGGTDTDGNGKPELFVMGNQFGPNGSSWTTYVFEATGNDAFAIVATISMPFGGSGLSSNALGNFDGVGTDEYVMRGIDVCWIYGARGPGVWELVQELRNPGPEYHLGVHAFDLNRNGRDELFWDVDVGLCMGYRTLIFEHPLPASTDAEWRGTGSLTLSPNPCRLNARVHLPATVTGRHWLTVYDARGRLVERRALDLGTGSPILWPARPAPAGVYWLRVEDGRGAALAAGRSIVVR
jgi:hypothetical protein